MYIIKQISGADINKKLNLLYHWYIQIKHKSRLPIILNSKRCLVIGEQVTCFEYV